MCVRVKTEGDHFPLRVACALTDASAPLVMAAGGSDELRAHCSALPKWRHVNSGIWQSARSENCLPKFRRWDPAARDTGRLALPASIWRMRTGGSHAWLARNSHSGQRAANGPGSSFKATRGAAFFLNGGYARLPNAILFDQ